MKRKAEKLEQKLQEEKLERLMKRGEGSDEKPIRSEVHGKENKTLKTFMKRYQNVDDNIETDINKLCTYQLVNEGGQFRQEHPTVRNFLAPGIIIMLLCKASQDDEFFHFFVSCHGSVT